MNNSVSANGLVDADYRDPMQDLVFEIKDQALVPGEEYQIDFQLHLLFYLLFTAGQNLVKFSKQKSLAPQDHWLVAIWEEALSTLLSAHHRKRKINVNVFKQIV